MPENHIEYQERLLSLRKEIEKRGLDGVVLPRTDEFQGEFLAPYAECLQWLSGFTGSAGVAIVLRDRAVVMSDGRYTIQLKDQVPSTLFETANSVDVSVGDWLAKNAKSLRIGYNPWLHTPKQIDAIEDKIADNGIILEPMADDILDVVWEGRPPKPRAPLSIFPHDVAGKTSIQKRIEIGERITNLSCDYALLTMGDSICWLLNVRGNDIAFSPLMLSYALIHKNGDVDWFVDKLKATRDVMAHIGAGVTIHDFNDLPSILDTLRGKILFDRGSAPVWFESFFKEKRIPRHEAEDLCLLPKAMKTPPEIEAIKQAHVIDGVAVTKFLYWLDKAVERGEVLDELIVEEKLESFRAAHPDYLGPSFSTIAGFNANGAIVHYRATEKTNAKINGDGLLLIDSGGQYQWGTTDITRTVAVGEPTDEMIEAYTLVLKGHIAVSDAVFDDETTGKDIDALARAPLQAQGMDYAHGTGHGVGCYLCVHEAAASISPRGERVFSEGMLISNEPGYYKEQAFGIRIENLILVQRSAGQRDRFMFETVTLAPYDVRLIDNKMLSLREKAWLREYNKSLCDTLWSYLDDAEKDWLEQRCL